MAYVFGRDGEPNVVKTLEQAPSPGERLKANDLMGRYGPGQVKGITGELRSDFMNPLVKIVQEEAGPEVFERISRRLIELRQATPQIAP